MLRFEVFLARNNEHWWRLIAANGRTIATSGEGYSSEYGAVRAARRTKELAPQAPIQRLDGNRLNEDRIAGYGDDPF